MAHPVKVAESDMEKFVRRLKLDLPASIKVHNVAVNALSGRWHYSEFWVDCWPDFNGVIAVPNKDAIPSFQGIYLLYGSEMSTKLLLKHCVRWDPPIEFQAVNENLYPALVEAASFHKVMETMCVDFNVYGLGERQKNRPELMEGYTTNSLSLEQLPVILQHWSYGIHYKHPSEYVRALISCFPTMGVFDCHGNLAAHTGLYNYGAVAFLGVNEQHQRRGIGKFLLSEIIDTSTKSGIIPHSNVVCGNTASINLHCAAGLVKLTENHEKSVFYSS